MLSGFYHFGVLFCSVVLGCRYTRKSRFLTGGVFECDIGHRRTVAVLCMLYKIRCYPMHPLHSALPVSHVPVRVTRSALVAHRHTYAPPRCRTSQQSRTFISFPSQCFYGTIFLTPYSMVRDWRVSRAGAMLFYRPKLLASFLPLLFSLSLLSFCMLVL